MRRDGLVAVGLVVAGLAAAVATAQGGSPPRGLTKLRAQEQEAEPARLRPLVSGTLGVGPGPAAITPPGSYDLSLTNDLKLGGAIFKNGEVFLHNDLVANTALGLMALDSLTTPQEVGDGALNTAIGYAALTSNTSGRSNTAVGDSALKDNLEGVGNTAVGNYALENSIGYYATAYEINSHLSGNTAVGFEALRGNTVGLWNTAVGYGALRDNQLSNGNTAVGYRALYQHTGYPGGGLGGNTNRGYNTAVGFAALYNVTTGDNNIALGHRAGNDLYGGESSNILLNSIGMSGESNVLRIGSSSGTANRQLNAAYIQGIYGRTSNSATATAVFVDVDGKLGTVSSSLRFKEDVHEIGERSERLLQLRPVVFRYKREAEEGRPGPVSYGLIAEEVAEVFPELVVYDDEGRPQTVKYHLLSSMLLNELQREHSRAMEREASLEARIAELWAVVERLPEVPR